MDMVMRNHCNLFPLDKAALQWNTTGKTTLYLPYNVKSKCVE